MTGQTTIVTVCYNSQNVLATMLESLPAGTPVVLVDNASANPEYTRNLAKTHGARLIENDRNVGFGVANNQGAALADTPFLLFLNPDARLESGCIAKLEQAAQDHPQASAFNPRLLDNKGADIFRRKTRLDPSFEVTGPVPEQASEMPSLSGAAIFVRREFFERISGFDEAIFLYHEDDDLSMRLRQLGPLMRIPSAVVTHQEGQSSARTPQVAALKAFHMARSKVYTYGKHGRPLPWARTMGQATLGLCSPLMLNTRKRAKALGFFKGTLNALKDGGRGFD